LIHWKDKSKHRKKQNVFTGCRVSPDDKNIRKKSNYSNGENTPEVGYQTTVTVRAE